MSKIVSACFCYEFEKEKNYSATSLPVSGADRLVNRPNDVTDLLCDLEAIIICKDSCCDNLVPVLTELARFFLTAA
jgi:hypothetical protein